MNEKQILIDIRNKLLDEYWELDAKINELEKEKIFSHNLMADLKDKIQALTDTITKYDIPSTTEVDAIKIMEKLWGNDPAFQAAYKEAKEELERESKDLIRVKQPNILSFPSLNKETE